MRIEALIHHFPDGSPDEEVCRFEEWDEQNNHCCRMIFTDAVLKAHYVLNPISILPEHRKDFNGSKKVGFPEDDNDVQTTLLFKEALKHQIQNDDAFEGYEWTVTERD